MDETIELFGSKISKYQDCNRCKAKLACRFTGYTYQQPCDACRETPEYKEEKAKSEADRKRKAKINEALEARIPAAYNATPWGTYLVTNKRGDVIREEKIADVEGRQDKKAKLRDY